MYAVSHSYCNWLIIAITCGFSCLGFRDPEFTDRYYFWPEAILARREYIRLVTSGFLHLNGRHLLMNMVSLYFFGPMIELVFGAKEFLIIYFAALIGGNLLSLYIHRYHDYRALGASGAVSGVIFAHIFLFPGGRINMLFVPIGIPSWLYAIGYIAASFYGMHRQLDNVGHDAHLGGALVGLFTAATLHPFAIRRNPLLFATISAATILLFIYVVRNPLFLPLDGLDFTKTKPKAKTPPTARRRWFQKNPPPASASKLTERQVEEILQKISASGIDSLTAEEKQLLSQVSEKYRRRGQTKDPKFGFPF
jgi:membrane associated rhomboid family serine protease